MGIYRSNRTQNTMALRHVYDSAMTLAAKQYRRVLGNQLSQYGLRYEDLLIEESAAVAEALNYADADVLVGRTRRLKRAIDLNYKKKNLNEYAPNMDMETWKNEIRVDIEKIQARDHEIAHLNGHQKM